eukprot:756173-Hanusia_phi.AAC.2
MAQDVVVRRAEGRLDDKLVLVPDVSRLFQREHRLHRAGSVHHAAGHPSSVHSCVCTDALRDLRVPNRARLWKFGLGKQRRN